MSDEITLNQVEPYVWEVPKSGEMLVPGRIYGDEAIIEHLRADIRAGKQWNALKQVVNVACLPGIQQASLAMAGRQATLTTCLSAFHCLPARMSARRCSMMASSP